MGRSGSNIPPPPELPAFRIEEEAAPTPTKEAIEQRHLGTGLVRHDEPLPEERIDPDAAKVVRRLERAGHEAYLVGGCVRDLLLGGTPKDFDVATSARPDDVRSLFRNCRVIGRRFRLAHVLFGGGKIVEVATFRKNPQTEGPELAEEIPDDILIRSDNVFGEAHEDALRRDFTINALFYDLDRRQVLDWCGGLDHIQHRVIHTIGEPRTRFREDPVRILRAIKFASRLDLGIAEDVYDAIVALRGELARAARPRVYEEILRLMRGGGAHRAMWLMWETGVMAVLLPELSSFLDDDEATNGGGERFWKRMQAIDQRTLHDGVRDDLVLWAALLAEPLAEATYKVRDVGAATAEFLEPLAPRIAMPRRIVDGLRRIIGVLPRLRPGRVARFARSELIGIALETLEIDLLARGLSTDAVNTMREEVLALAPQAIARPGYNRSPAWRRNKPTARHR
jgi:poly(A) polymerase